MIRVYNTLSKSKEPLETVHPGKVGIYLCGPTVYKPSHIGHMVGPVVFDAIKRYLTYSGYQVTWVVNVTDVDDKLIVESNARGIPMSQLAAEMTADYMRNLEAMGIDTIDHFPKATEHIPHIVEFTADLVEKGFAYPSDGDVRSPKLRVLLCLDVFAPATSIWLRMNVTSCCKGFSASIWNAPARASNTMPDIPCQPSCSLN
jgi:cysteinyl-tRNA synthetase